MIEQSGPKQPKISPLPVLAVIFASLSFSMLFFSTYGPLSSSLIPFHPMGWAGMFVFLAMICAYSHRYQKTKDNFWFILALMFFPVLLSDLYFFPIPPVLGLGMAEWMGVQSLVTLVCFTVVCKTKVLRYSNLALLLLLPLSAAAFWFPKLGLSTFLMATAYVGGIVVSATLSYFAYKRKEYFLIVGVLLNFLVSMPIPTLYIASGYLPFGWNHEMMAVVTDRIAIFGRILMVISLPSLLAFVKMRRGSS